MAATKLKTPTTTEITLDGKTRDVAAVAVDVLGETYVLPKADIISRSLLGLMRKAHSSYKGADKASYTEDEMPFIVLSRLEESCEDGAAVVAMIDSGEVDVELFFQNWGVSDLGK